MKKTPPSTTLPDLDARLAAYRKRQAEEEAGRFHRRFVVPGSMFEFSTRVVNDLIAAILISVAFGATIDSAFNSWPWGIVGMFLLGAAAAVRNLYQTAGRMADLEAAHVAETVGRVAESTEDAAPSAQPITERG